VRQSPPLDEALGETETSLSRPVKRNAGRGPRGWCVPPPGENGPETWPVKPSAVRRSVSRTY